MRVTYTPAKGWNVELEIEDNTSLGFFLVVFIPILCSCLAFVTWAIGSVFN